MRTQLIDSFIVAVAIIDNRSAAFHCSALVVVGTFFHSAKPSHLGYIMSLSLMVGAKFRRNKWKCAVVRLRNISNGPYVYLTVAQTL